MIESMLCYNRVLTEDHVIYFISMRCVINSESNLRKKIRFKKNHNALFHHKSTHNMFNSQYERKATVI